MCENDSFLNKNYKNLKKIAFILLKVVVSFLQGFPLMALKNKTNFPLVTIFIQYYII